MINGSVTFMMLLDIAQCFKTIHCPVFKPIHTLEAIENCHRADKVKKALDFTIMFDCERKPRNTMKIQVVYKEQLIQLKKNILRKPKKILRYIYHST